MKKVFCFLVFCLLVGSMLAGDAGKSFSYGSVSYQKSSSKQCYVMTQLKNNSSKDWEYVCFKVDVFDKKGNYLDRGVDCVGSFKPGESKGFRGFVLTDKSNIGKVRIYWSSGY